MKVAFVLMAASALIYSIQNLDVKLFSRHDNSFWGASFARGLVGLLISVLVAKYRHLPLIPPSHIRYLVYRGALGGLTNIAGFYAVSKTDLARATVLLSTAPLWTAAFSQCLLSNNEKKRWIWSDTLAAILCTSGVLVIFHSSHPFTNLTAGVGEASALLSAMCQAGVNILICELPDEDAVVITLYGMGGSVLFSLPGLIYEHTASHGTHIASYTWKDALALSSVGVLSYGAQWTKSLALQMAASIDVLVIRYLEVFYACLWDWAVFHHIMNVSSIIGCFLIVVGCITICTRCSHPCAPKNPVDGEEDVV